MRARVSSAVPDGAKRALTPSTRVSGTTFLAVPPCAVVTVSVSWNSRPSTTHRLRLHRRRARQEARGPDDRVLALPGARSVSRPAVERDVGVHAADAARVHRARRRLADEREGRPPDEPRRGEQRPQAVQVREALLPVVEDADGREVVRGSVLEHGEDRRVAALHVRGAAADHAQSLAVGPMLGPRRHRVEVAHERDGARRRAGPCARRRRCRDAPPARPRTSGSASRRDRRASPPRPSRSGTATSSSVSSASRSGSNEVTPRRRSRAGRRSGTSCDRSTPSAGR